MSDIVLSAATRNSLLAAQNTAALLGTTQNHLSTGKKVTSALDNPLNFFTAASLDSRSGDLSGLLDAISNGVQTIQAASTGITNIQKLVDSARSTANQALSATESSTGTGTTFGTSRAAVSATPAVVGSSTSSAAIGSLTNASQLNGTGLALAANDVVTVGGKSVTITTASSGASDSTHIKADDTIANLISKLNALTGTANLSFDDTSHTFTATSTDLTGASQVTIGGVSSTKLLLSASTNAAVAVAAAPATRETVAGGAVSFIVNGVTKSTTLAAHASIDDTVTALNTAAGSSIFSKNATGDGLVLNASSNVTITDSSTKTLLGFGAGSITNTGADTRANLATQYNSLLTQIDQLASDASYNGVNLLNSADPTNKLHLAFNEKDTSNLDIQGVNAKSSGLGLTAIDTSVNGTGNFLSDTDIKSTLSALTTATSSLRSYSSTFGSNLTVVQNRQDFTKGLINTLQTGSAALVNADLNEEAANSQALSTRQSLAVSALSLANQSQQSILQLLR